MIINKNPRLTHLTLTAGLIIVLLVIVFSLPAVSAKAAELAQIAPSLGAAGSFAVLGGSTVTNTGATSVNGDLGVWPGISVTGFPPGTVTGAIYNGDAVAQNAQAAAQAAYVNLSVQACNQDLTGQNLGGLILTPGVYCFDSLAQLTGILTLDAQNDENSVFIFQIGSTLTTASNSSVSIINDGNLCNVFWQVGSSAAFNAATMFLGNVVADQSITLYTGATLSGRAIALNGAVTMDTNIITMSVCAAQPPSTPTTTSTSISTPTLTLTTAPDTTFTTASTTPEPEFLPSTGGDLTGTQTPGTPLLRIGLGILGLGLVLFGLLLVRKKRTLKK